MGFPQLDIPHWGHLNFPMQLVIALRVWAQQLATKAYIPAKAVFFFNLSSEDIDSYFVAGVGRGEYNGWAICDGSNGTPNLIDRFVRVTTGAAGGTGGSDSSAHTHSVPAHSHDAGSLVAQITLRTTDPDIAMNRVNTTSWNATHDLTVASTVATSAQNPGTGAQVAGSTATDGSGTSGDASATDNRPAYYQLTALMRL